MRRIAFLSFDWDYEIIAEYYLGMQAYLEAHPDLQLVIFSAFGHYYASFEADEHSFEVFKLCRLEDYDGFIIQGNRSWPPERRQRLVDQMRAQGKPVISLNYALEGAHTIGTDNYQAMYHLVRAVLEDRGIRRPAFVNGLATSVEAQERRRGYRDACADLGIRGARVIQANWQIESGVEVARQLLDEPGPLPEAIFCCNDDLAVGLMETLQAAGLRVPEDVMISGFDHRELSLRPTPHVTTVDRDYYRTAGMAIDALGRLLAEEELPNHISSPVAYVLTRSCGYAEDVEQTSIGELYALDTSLKRFYEVLNQFQTSVLGVDTLQDVLELAERFAPEVRCPNVYLTISDRYLQYHSPESLSSYGTVSYLMAVSGRGVGHACDERHIYASFLTEGILPVEVAMDQPVYTVYPIRHSSTCIGTMVTEGVSPIIRHGFLTFFITLLAGSIESVRKNELLSKANERLNDLYVHDELTGLFNRFGLERFGALAYDRLLRDFGAAWFTFVDIDSMKQINDRLGHDVGDLALRDTSDIIRRATLGEDAFAMRYGGDEFLLISRDDVADQLRDELRLLRSSSGKPFCLGLSIGSCRIEAKDRLSMAEAIQKADTSMYEIKKAHKAR